VSDIDISASIAFHKQHGGRVTIAAVQPAARFRAHWGWMEPSFTSFQEKPQGEGGWNQWWFLCVVTESAG